MAFEFFSKKAKQEGVVRNEEKARDMASIEAEYRDLDAAFKEYCADPPAFTTENAKREEEARAEGLTIFNDTRTFVDLYQAGVRPGDLTDYGESLAEFYGNEYDFQESLKSKNPLMIKAQLAILKLQNHFWGKAFDAHLAVAELPNLFKDGPNMFTQHLIDQLGIGDEHAAEAEAYRQLLDQNERLQRMAEEELERRNPSGAVSAA